MATLITCYLQRRASTSFASSQWFCSHKRRRDLQHRAWISGYLRDVWRSGSLSPENPLIKAIDATKSEEYLPCLSLIEADHVKQAIRHVKEKQAVVRSCHDKIFKEPESTENENEASIREFIRAVNALEDPALSLRQICAMMMHLGKINSSSVNAWQNAAVSVSNEFPPFQGITSIPVARLKNMEHWLKNSTAPPEERQTGFAVDFLLQKYKNIVGIVNLSCDETVSDVASRYRELGAILEDIEKNLLCTKSFRPSPSLLSNVYNCIGIRTERAKLLGYDNAIDQVLSHSSVTSISDIHAIHDVIEQVITPKIRALTGTKSEDENQLESYLKPTSSADPIMNAKQMDVKRDQFNMMKLEKHVTLDGALKSVFHLLHMLTGISFELVENPKETFKSETLIFRAFNGDKSMGTLIIDPLPRTGSVHGAVSIPILAKSDTREPLVCMSLSVGPPPWTGDPITVNWEDCESLFHEMGHCIQLLAGNSELGSVIGPANLPADVSEFFPKESTVKAMISFSHCDEPFSEESLSVAQRVESRTKMFKLAEQAFRSKLEISVLSDFDLKGAETVMDLQVRIARAFVPHCSVEKNNIEHLVALLNTNSAGCPVASYRYLWSDFASASVFVALKQCYETNPESAMEAFRENVRRVVLFPGAAADFSALLGLYGGNHLATTHLLKLV